MQAAPPKMGAGVIKSGPYPKEREVGFKFAGDKRGDLRVF